MNIYLNGKEKTFSIYNPVSYLYVNYSLHIGYPTQYLLSHYHVPKTDTAPGTKHGPLFLSLQAGKHDFICKGFSYSHHRTELVPPLSEISNYVYIQLSKHISYKFQSTVNPHHVKDCSQPSVGQTSIRFHSKSESQNGTGLRGNSGIPKLCDLGKLIK